MASTNNMMSIVTMVVEASSAVDQTVIRRTADYKPNIWKYELLQSLGTEFDEEEYRRQAQKLKEEVEHLFVETHDDFVAKLEILNNIEKLGLTTYFQKEFTGALENIVPLANENNFLENFDLYATSLCFSLLRRHGFNVSQDLFLDFTDKLEKSNKNSKVKEIVGLFEASHLAMEGENILEEAKTFSTNYLKGVYTQLKGKLAKEVNRALELSSNLRVEWYNVRNHIQGYEKDDGSNPSLIKLAKLNFIMVQSVLQNDLKQILRWWKKLEIMKSLGFTRNRIVESYLWAAGVAFEPKYGNLRKWLAKVIKLVLIIDDIYDVFGSLQELEIFTDIVKRWDFEGSEILPHSMKVCMKTLYDTVDEITHEIQNYKGWNSVLPYIQKSWQDFCEGLLVEARWYYNGYTPTLHEYLENGWITSCGPLLAVHISFSVSCGPQQEAIDFLENHQEHVYHTSMIVRLCNDQGTSTAELKRGDAPTSLLCHMREANVSEELARKYIRSIISDTWKKINKSCISQSPSIKCTTNMARVAHFIYLNGDGFGFQQYETRDLVQALLVEPLVIH